MILKNTASQFVYFQGVDASTHSIKSGVTWTIRRSIDGTFGAGGGTVTEDGSTGWYKYALAQADTNGNSIGLNFTGTGAIPQTVQFTTTAQDIGASIPQTGDAYLYLTAALTESYSALHGQPTMAQALYQILSMLQEKSITTTTVTTKKRDGSTSAMTFTLNDPSSPTAITRAS